MELVETWLSIDCVSCCSSLTHALPDTSTHFELTGAVDTLLTKWQSRFPHPKLDPISVWDDIVTTRFRIVLLAQNLPICAIHNKVPCDTGII